MTDFLHNHKSFNDLLLILEGEKRIVPGLLEKDYWIMHCLWGMQQLGLSFELKGGTSLSKGFDIIERFSEDIDIQIHPDKELGVKSGKNQDKPLHIESRKNFFAHITECLIIEGLQFARDHSFDDHIKMRGAGIRGEYQSFFNSVPGIKEGILLEVGFDKTTPNLARDITSFAYEKAASLRLGIIDNRAMGVYCYAPEYTFVEKLQAISTKYRIQQQDTAMPVNFLRHYYDVYRLLELDRVVNFIGSSEYNAHKERRFRGNDELDLKKNEAFTIPNQSVRKLYSEEFKKKSAMYFGKQVEFEEMLDRINKYVM